MWRRLLKLGLVAYSLTCSAAEKPSVEELGRWVAAELRNHTTAIESPLVQDYLDRLGQKLAPGLPAEIRRFTFSAIVDNNCAPMHAPIALLGGYVFVPAALFLDARSEAEFAGVLARAMVESARPVLVPPRRGSLQRFPMFVGARPGCVPYMAVPADIQDRLAKLELDADGLAIRALAQAGFDPEALAQYTERAQPDSSTVPTLAAHLARMRSAIANLPTMPTLPPYGDGSAGPAFTAVKEEVRRLTAIPKAPSEPPSLRK
jgi:predicted Zn-dependent protease